MSRRRLLRQTVLVAATLLGVVVTSCCGVIVLGRTVLASAPTSPRDRPAPPAASSSQSPLRMTVLGTSLSSATRYRWPDEVGAQLASRIGRPVEVSRVANPGATSTWGANQIDAVIATDPDVVLVELAVNDADVRHNLTVAASTARHEDILAELRAGRPDAQIILLTMNPASGVRSWARPFLSRYYAEYVSLAEHHDTGLVDLYPRWTALSAAERELGDGLHPSDAAATRVLVGPVVETLVDAAQR